MIALGYESMIPFILASNSSRRRQLLADAGYLFDVVPPPIPEPDELPQGLSAAGYAEALAFFKARSVSEKYRQQYVLGADTIVALGGRILGKPTGAAEARDMLAALSSNRHAVITGVAMLGPGDTRQIASETTYVTMRPMTEEEIDDYITSGEWKDKAGAYAIQETADQFIRAVDGSFSNVVGLPMELLGQIMARLDKTSG